MSYVVLARRFRPQNFDDIIGQEHVSRTLKNAISENRVAHAYLFSGPRGVGKTTSARILAKALNCKKGLTDKPCDECANCREIISGTSVDVQEIDGASNRGIDEIRALRENVKFSPASSRYKIYIIDEAHQITDAAFNALLKTIEEPPAHVIFVLATTEPQKIPITILSRCQRYRFRLLSSKEITSTLEKIVEIEKFKIEHDALQVITESAGGSLRDALSLMDQVISFASGQITAKDVQELLGFLPKEIISDTIAALADHDSSKIISIVRDVSQQGYSLVQFARDLREHLHQMLLYKLNPEVLEITTSEKDALDGQKQLFSSGWLIRSGHLLSKLIDEMRWNSQPRLILELYLLRLAQPYVPIDELINRLEQLEKNGDFSDLEGPRTVSSHEPGKEKSNTIKKKTEEVKLEPRSDTVLKQAAEVKDTSAASSIKNPYALWSSITSEFKNRSPVVSNVLKDATVREVVGSSIVIAVKNRFQQDGINRNKAVIEAVLEEKTGSKIGLSIIIDDLQKELSPKEEVLIMNEEDRVLPAQDVYKVTDDLSESKDVLPPEMEKISSKFPGKIKKKK